MPKRGLIDESLSNSILLALCGAVKLAGRLLEESGHERHPALLGEADFSYNAVALLSATLPLLPFDSFLGVTHQGSKDSCHGTLA